MYCIAVINSSKRVILEGYKLTRGSVHTITIFFIKRSIIAEPAGALASRICDAIVATVTFID
jgi:hypothetical protein